MAPPLPPPTPSLSPSYAAENNSTVLLATCIAFLAIETTSILLLYTSRFLSTEKNKAANWSMLALMSSAYIVCLGKISIGLLAIHIGGAGRHLLTLPRATLTTALQLNTALQLICPLTTSLSKMSILCLFHTLFGRTSPRALLFIRTTFFLCAATLLLQLLIPLLNCRPFPSTWSLTAPPSACAIPGLALWKYLSIPNLVTTLLVVCIPVPALARLKVSTRNRVAMGVVLGLCVAGVGAAVMRFASFLRVRSFEDFTFEQVGPLCWTVAESGTYMVAGVVPTLRPLVGRCAGWRFERVVEGGSGECGSEERRVVKKEDEFDMLRTEDTVVGGEDVEKGTN